MKTRLHDTGLLVLRVGMSVLLLTHGFPKLMRLFEGSFQFSDPIGIGPAASLIITVIGEFLVPILIIVGYRTRLISLLPIAIMAVAAFLVHAQDPFKVKEKALLFLLGFVVVYLCGPGKYSVDYRLR